MKLFTRFSLSTLLIGAVTNGLILFVPLAAETESSISPDQLCLRSATSRLFVATGADGFRIQLESDNEIVLSQPAEGLWSVAMGWQEDWPTDWVHGSPSSVEKKGPWLVFSGEIPTESGAWLVRDSFISEGDRFRCVRRWEWTGEQQAERVTLSVRWQAPAPGASLMMPGFCYYGNPSGNPDRVAKFSGGPDEELFCEEHRLPMPFASLEWGEDKALKGAALHTLPSLAPFGNLSDQWWSIGAGGNEGYVELALLSGPCSLNGRRGYVKANQTKWWPYTDTFLSVPPGGVIEKTFFLQAYPVAQKGSGFIPPLNAALDIFQPFYAEDLPGFPDIVEAKYRFAYTRWHESDTSAGFRMYPFKNEYVMGWCGQAAAPGYALIVLADRLHSSSAPRMAQRSLDHLATAPLGPDGFPVRFNPEDGNWYGMDPVSQGQAMENFARAILAGRSSELVHTDHWETFLKKTCDLHARRILQEDWHPVSTNEAFFISPLCKAYKLFGEDLHRRAALKAAKHYAKRHLDMNEPYWGGTLDASCEDKEGAWAAFQGFLAVYEMTGETRFLSWAEHAMNVTLTYTCIWDIDMPPGRLRDHDLKTRGWTVVSAQNQHLDVFGVLFSPEIYRMGDYLNREDLQQLAIVMFRSCGQMIDPDGSQGEQLNHTNFAQMNAVFESASDMRGTYGESWTVFWITAHFLNAAAQFEEMGVFSN